MPSSRVRDEIYWRCKSVSSYGCISTVYAIRLIKIVNFENFNALFRIKTFNDNDYIIIFGFVFRSLIDDNIHIYVP
jgi:hypothetical protein